MRSSHHPNQSFGVYGVILLIFIFCIMMILHQTANASHMRGAELSYKNLSGRTYQVEYTLYRDCSGQTAPQTMNLKVQSNSCSNTLFASLVLDLSSGQEISHFCPSALSTCQGGNFIGIQAWKYTAQVNIPADCPDWIFSVTDCCRNPGINTIASPSSANIYLEAFLNNSASQNSAAEFNNSPESLLILNQSQTINASASDKDGDSLVYTLCAPKTDMDQNVTYLNSFDAANQFGSPMILNPATGEININPSLIITGLIAVQVKDYKNGIMVGSITRDFQMSVQASTNSIPVLSGINGGNSRVYTLCPDTKLDITINTSDEDANQQLSVNWYTDLPEAKITVGNEVHPVIQVMWNPEHMSNLKKSYTIRMRVTDDACPFTGSTEATYTIILSDLRVQLKSQDIVCSGSDNGSIASLVSGGTAPYTYNWTDYPVNNPDRKNLTEGIYNVIVHDASNCAAEAQIEIKHLSEAPVISLGGSLSSCEGTPLELFAGNSENTYRWSDESVNSSITVSRSGVYSVVATNAFGCSASASVRVQFDKCSAIDYSKSGESSLSVYPNPAVDVLHVDFKNDKDSHVTISISDLSGKVLETRHNEYEQENISHFDLSKLQAGMYIVQVKSEHENRNIKFFHTNLN